MQRATWFPAQRMRQRRAIALILIGLGFVGAGIGMTVQSVREYTTARSYAHASPCSPGQRTGCRLLVPATVVAKFLSGGRYTNYNVSLHYLGADHDGQQLIGSHGYSRLYAGEPVTVELFDEHVLQIDANGTVLKPEWLPGRWWLHLIVAAVFALLGVATLPIGVRSTLLARRHGRPTLDPQ
jgi:hypothetical protein